MKHMFWEGKARRPKKVIVLYGKEEGNKE